MVSPLENAHLWMATRANPRRIRLRQLLEAGVMTVTQRNGYK